MEPVLVPRIEDADMSLHLVAVVICLMGHKGTSSPWVEKANPRSHPTV